MAAVELDSSSFDEVSLHDVRVYGFLFQRLEPQGNLIVDIDYIAEWPCDGAGGRSFLVVPVTLTLCDVVDVQIRLDWGEKSIHKKPPCGVIFCPLDELIVGRFSRSAYTDPLYASQPKPYFRYELDFWEPTGARIGLGAKDFRIVSRQAPLRVRRQVMDPARRIPLAGGGIQRHPA